MARTASNRSFLIRGRVLAAVLVCAIAAHWTGARAPLAQQLYVDPKKGALQVDRSRDPYAPGYAKARRRSGTIGPGLYPPGTRTARARATQRKIRDCPQLRRGASRRERARHYRQCRSRR